MIETNRTYVKEIVVILGIVLFCVLCFYKYFLFGDSIYTFAANITFNPIKYLTATKLIHGEYPLWIPYLYGGVPLYSGIGVLDPFQLFHILLPPQDAFIVGAFTMICIGGIGMYVLLRHSFSFSRFSSFIGACLFASNPFAGSRLVDSALFLMPHLLLPWIFYFLYMSVKKRSLFWVALGSIPFSMTYYSGNIQSTAFITLFMVFYLISFWLLEKIENANSGMALSLGKGMVVLFFFAALLMAAEILPMLELIVISQYPMSDSSYAWKTILIFIGIVIYFISVLGLRSFLNLTETKAFLYALLISFFLLLMVFILKRPERGIYSLIFYLKHIFETMIVIPPDNFSGERFNYFEISHWFRFLTLPFVAISFFLKKNIETIIFLALIVAYTLVPYSIFNADADRLAFIPLFALVYIISGALNKLQNMKSDRWIKCSEY